MRAKTVTFAPRIVFICGLAAAVFGRAQTATASAPRSDLRPTAGLLENALRRPATANPASPAPVPPASPPSTRPTA